MGKLPILYLAVVSALFLKTLTFIPEAKPYQFQSAALAQEISTPKWKKRYIELTKKARLSQKARRCGPFDLPNANSCKGSAESSYSSLS